MSERRFIIGAIMVLGVGALRCRVVVTNAYVFYAGFVALQYVVIRPAWNILGGYAGYVNFGSGGFVGLGTYAAIFLFNAVGRAAVGPDPRRGVRGRAVRPRHGIPDACASKEYTFPSPPSRYDRVLNTVIVNWNFVGGARGATVLAPPPPIWFPSTVSYVFFAMLVLAVIEHSGGALDRTIMDRAWPGGASGR